MPGLSTIVAPATPPGRGALGIVRLSGPESSQVALALSDRKRPFEPRRASLHWILDGDARIDQALFLYYPEGESYTGEESVEITAHGSPYVLERILSLCLDRGAVFAGPGEFTARAYRNGRLDLSQAEAVCALIAARTKNAHRAAVDMLEGGLSRRIEPLRDQLVSLSALIEANLDHPDDDLPPLDDARAVCEFKNALTDLQSLTAGTRRSLDNGAARIAIVGSPNAGKSSLLNALLGRDRAIVSETPGTTRDTLDVLAELGGVEASLIDTAGVRDDPADAIEREGRTRSMRALAGADLALLVLDGTLETASHARTLETIVPAAQNASVPMVIALNKNDLPQDPELSKRLASIGTVLHVSAKTGDGIERLEAALINALNPAAPESSRLAVSKRQGAALSACETELAEALAAFLAGAQELSAVRLRSALALLSSIDGRGVPEDVLAEIFSRFCVGK